MQILQFFKFLICKLRYIEAKDWVVLFKFSPRTRTGPLTRPIWQVKQRLSNVTTLSPTDEFEPQARQYDFYKKFLDKPSIDAKCHSFVEWYGIFWRKWPIFIKFDVKPTRAEYTGNSDYCNF